MCGDKDKGKASSELKQNPSRTPNWVEIITLIIVVLGGILGYYLIHKPQLDIQSKLAVLQELKDQLDVDSKKYRNEIDRVEAQSKHLKDQLDIESKKYTNEIDRVEAQNKYLNQQLDIESKKYRNEIDRVDAGLKLLKEQLSIKEQNVRISLDVPKTIHDLMPAMIVKLNTPGESKKNFSRINNELTINGILRNSGDFSFLVDNPTYKLYKINDGKEKELGYKKDYTTQYLGFYGYFPHHTEEPFRILLVIKDLLPTDRYRLHLHFRVQTPPEMVDAVSNYLKDFIPENQLKVLTVKTFDFHVPLNVGQIQVLPEGN